MSEELIPKAAWIAWGIIGVAYAAACIWTGVRLFNRRERWTKWTAVALAVMPMMYILSSGPMTMVAVQSRVTHTPTVLPDGTSAVTASSETSFGLWFPIAYAPLFWGSEQAGSDALFMYWMLFPHQSTFVDS